MKLLLDTHAFLWAVTAPARLGARARRQLLEATSDVAVSAATFWEIALKFTLGKLDLEGAGPEDFPPIAERHGFACLPLTAELLATSHRFPRRHATDPFDRLIAWHAVETQRVLVTRDVVLRALDVRGLRTLW